MPISELFRSVYLFVSIVSRRHGKLTPGIGLARVMVLAASLISLSLNGSLFVASLGFRTCS